MQRLQSSLLYLQSSLLAPSSLRRRSSLSSLSLSPTPSSEVFFKNQSHPVPHLLRILQWSHKCPNYTVSRLPLSRPIFASLPLVNQPSATLGLYLVLLASPISPAQGSKSMVFSANTLDISNLCTHIAPYLAPSHRILRDLSLTCPGSG